MTNRTAATRYARALIDVALKEQADLAIIESQLTALASLVEQHTELRKALTNPSVPVPRKRAAIDALLADRDRLALLSDVAEAVRQRLLDIRNIVRAQVTTAEPLAADRLDAITRGLAVATGRTVELTPKVDPSIVGGMIAKVGSTVYDASVTSHLQRIRQRLDATL